ncbi:MAG: tRNA pseudouridine(38-40) synthase TruA [Clostridia bacterium]|nr:tRNA pseudouridine(38-40) synthase TruA [Clostridia bacterium]
MRYVMKIAYDGTNYAGWQRQKNAVSIQEKAELAVLDALGVKVNITASGRTDAGVHATGQVCQFDADLTVPPQKMPDCLNRYLPEDIRIVDGWQGADDFDCNRSAKRKTYCYSLYVSERDMPLKDRYATRVENAPSLEILQAAAKLFEGEHDFKAFCASGSSVKTTVRTVYEVRVEESQSYHSRDLKIYVTGNGFLYNMVRTLVGELLDIASNRKTQESLKQAFASGRRELLGKTMPAKGLTLVDVCYEEK